MKKLIFLGTFLFSLLSAKAQMDPLSQFVNDLVLQDLMAYDSITVSLDSGAAFVSAGASRQTYLINGQIDTLTIWQMGTPTLVYKGMVSGNKTVVSGVNIANGGTDSVERLTHFADVNGRDSAVSYSVYAASAFNELGELRFKYNSNGLISSLDIFVPGFGNVGDWEFFYDQQRLDSLYYEFSLSGSGPGRMEFVYEDASLTRLKQVETYEDINNDGEKDLVQVLETQYNSQGKINEINNLSWDAGSLSLQLVGSYRYGIQSNSSLGLITARVATVSLYPNPASEMLHLVGTDDNFERFEIYTLEGRKVLEGKFSNKISLQGLPHANYLLLLKGEEAVSLRFAKK